MDTATFAVPIQSVPWFHRRRVVPSTGGARSNRRNGTRCLAAAERAQLPSGVATHSPPCRSIAISRISFLLMEDRVAGPVPEFMMFPERQSNTKQAVNPRLLSSDFRGCPLQVGRGNRSRAAALSILGKTLAVTLFF